MASFSRATRILAVATSLALSHLVRAATPVIVQNESGIEGLEESSVIYFPDSNTFENDPTNFTSHVDEGGGLFRDTLRNEYPTPLAPYASGPGWWDGDRATTNTDRQRTEAKGIVGLSHQKANQTYEYSFDFRTNPGFSGTSHFCHIFQLKETENGSSGFPLVTLSLYKSGSSTVGEIIAGSENSSNGITTTTARTFSFTPNTWYHVVMRVTTTDGTTTTGSLQGSVNGDAFSGVSNIPLWSDNGAGSPSDDYRTKFGLYRGMGTSYGVPAGDSWIEHRTVTGYTATSNVLTWKGGVNSNAWDSNTTANFLNGSASSVFNLDDQVDFDNTSANTSVTLSGALAPNFVRVNSSQNYSFGGAGSLAGGCTLRKDGTGTLTVSTSNSYQGLTDVRAGTLYVTGSIGNNSLASITGGTFRAGSSAALGTNSTIGTQINGGALDINGFNLSTEPVSLQGSGVNGTGAIVNTGAQQTSALTNVTLTGDATFGGSGRWDIRGTGATLGAGSASYNLTKVGSNQISLVGANVDSTLGNININQGVLAFQTSTNSMGDSNKMVTIASGAALDFFNTTAVMNKLCTLNGGTIWGESGTGSQNTFSGPITLTSLGGTLDAGGALTGGTPNASAVLNIAGNIFGSGSLTKNGPGLVTLSSSNSYSGNTTVNAGTLVLNKSFTTGANLSIASGAVTKLVTGALVLKTKSISITGTGSLDLNDGALIVDYTGSTPISNIRTLLQQGHASGSWTGSGITSSSAAAIAADPSQLHKSGLGYADTSSIAVGSIPGQTLDQTSIVVRYTLAGDANLDQLIDTTDFTAMASHFGQTGDHWFQGDFNYDGIVNALDFNILASNFGAILPAPPILEATVPEPSAPVIGVSLLSIIATARLRNRSLLRRG